MCVQGYFCHTSGTGNSEVVSILSVNNHGKGVKKDYSDTDSGSENDFSNSEDEGEHEEEREEELNEEEREMRRQMREFMSPATMERKVTKRTLQSKAKTIIPANRLIGDSDTMDTPQTGALMSFLHKPYILMTGS
jgi:hypothetical protein